MDINVHVALLGFYLYGRTKLNHHEVENILDLIEYGYSLDSIGNFKEESNE